MYKRFYKKYVLYAAFYVTDEVIAIGDSYNDLAMIEFAGLGVAMGNAREDIKGKANHITDTNMNDGVAIVVEEFILKPVSVS